MLRSGNTPALLETVQYLSSHLFFSCLRVLNIPLPHRGTHSEATATTLEELPQNGKTLALLRTLPLYCTFQPFFDSELVPLIVLSRLIAAVFSALFLLFFSAFSVSAIYLFFFFFRKF
jgi:hypothetical protein